MMHPINVEPIAAVPAPVPMNGEASPRQKVLMLAFACGPGRGSEPGQGWHFARGMAAHHDVWVLAYSGFRKVIEAELEQRPVYGLNVGYYHLPLEHPRHCREGVDRHGLAEQIHYYLWNLGASRVAQALHARVDFDLVHHVSFMRYWSPSAAAAVGIPFVWGPVGGGESAPKSFYSTFGKRGRFFERARDFARGLAHFDPFVRLTARRASIALATTEQSAERIRQLGPRSVEVAGAVALDDQEIAQLGELPSGGIGPLRFISVGRLLHWKGFEFGLRAFARALKTAGDLGDRRLENSEYWIVGDGPERARLETVANELGIASHVRFTGNLPRTEVVNQLAQAHVFVHPSFHDSGGYATLEAMAAGRPVICLDLGGPGLHVTKDCGIAVSAETPTQVIEDLSDAMLRLAGDRNIGDRMGKAARLRVVQNFSWDSLLAHVRVQYLELTGRHDL